MTARLDVTASALGWMGTPYKHLGRDRFGLDCVGLIIRVANDTGITGYDTLNYSRRPNSHEFMREMKDHLDRKHLRDAVPGDIVMFRGPRVPCHVGILVEPDLIVHAYLPARKVVRERLSGHLARLAVCAYSYRGLED